MFKKGDKIYCHSNGFSTGSVMQFCTSGHFYKIESIGVYYDDEIDYVIKDNLGANRVFRGGELINGTNRWFYINRRNVLTEKTYE